uniref:Uncharacterized protein n=1 Tax=Arundo donax TaxID=35708 RepID=A0A0A9GTI2_ARUDO
MKWSSILADTGSTDLFLAALPTHRYLPLFSAALRSPSIIWRPLHRTKMTRRPSVSPYSWLDRSIGGVGMVDLFTLA